MVSTLQSCRGTEIAGHLPTTRIIDEAHGRQVLVKNEAEVPLFKHEPKDRYWPIGEVVTRFRRGLLGEVQRPRFAQSEFFAF